MAKVSAILVCQNAEAEIDRCLGSVRWADEIVVIDSFSSDRTLELARRYTTMVLPARVPRLQPPGGARRRVLHAATGCSSSTRTRSARRSWRPRPGPSPTTRRPRPTPRWVTTVLRRVQAFGKWIDHGGWYPEYKLRFFRRDAMRCEHQEVHGAFAVEGPVARLEGDALPLHLRVHLFLPAAR